MSTTDCPMLSYKTLTAYCCISERPNLTISCPSPDKIGEGGNFICVCKSVGGNPPPNITWYHGGGQIGETSYGENTLNITNVTKQNSGTYTCVVQSYILKNNISTELIVYGKYVLGRLFNSMVSQRCAKTYWFVVTLNRK